MNDPRIGLLRDMIAGIQAQCALALGLIGQMQTGPPGESGAVTQRPMQARGPKHYGEAEPEPASDAVAKRLAELAGAEAPPNAPAGASTTED